mmetsp:Transcript_2092/g.3844  ORF Transcript_2092/g.3844 Transcript_2092/m.3844 type:complete len:155 (-) Transcript_2092:45-509(-)
MENQQFTLWKPQNRVSLDEYLTVRRVQDELCRVEGEQEQSRMNGSSKLKLRTSRRTRRMEDYDASYGSPKTEISTPRSTPSQRRRKRSVRSSFSMNDLIDALDSPIQSLPPPDPFSPRSTLSQRRRKKLVKSSFVMQDLVDLLESPTQSERKYY